MKSFAIIGLAGLLLASTAGLAQAAKLGVSAGANGAAHANSHSAASAKAGLGADAGAGAQVTLGGDDEENGTSANAKSGAAANAKADADLGASASTYGSVISNLRSGQSSDIDLSTVTDQSNINIITLSSLKGNAAANAQALDNALSAKAGAEADMQAKISNNDAIMTRLDDADFTASEVIAVHETADGRVTLYVDDRD